MPDLPKLPPLGPVIDWSPRRAEETAEDLYRAAERRLHTDPLFAARVTLARRVLDSVHQRPIDGHDAGWARMGAAVALLVAERPELITGESARRRPASDVLAEALARRVPSALPLSAIREAAGHLLGALTDAGWDLIRRADRFATLADDGRQVRIPTRGRCLTCYGEVSRGVTGGRGEVLIAAWAHIDPDASHDDAAITAVDAP